MIQNLRSEEKSSLEAIYGSSFEEQCHGHVWKIKVYPPELKGLCAGLVVDIHFPLNSVYPWEPPVTSVCTIDSDKNPSTLPYSVCLNISRILVEAAQEKLKKFDWPMPFIFNLISALNDENKLLDAIHSPPLPHSLPTPLPQRSHPLLERQETRRTVFDIQDSKSFPKVLKENTRLKKEFHEKVKSSKYFELQNQRQTLPAWQFKESVLSNVHKSPVVIIEGSAGCGKSTQVRKLKLYFLFLDILIY